MRIPKQFQIINRWYSVEVKTPPSHTDDSPLCGECDAQLGRIYLNMQECGNRNNLEHTFLHELVHACLDGIGRSKLSKDEDFVDSLAGALHQCIQTKTGVADE